MCITLIIDELRCLINYLGDKYPLVVELGLDHIFIEGFGVELVTRPALDGVSEVADDHVVLLLAVLQLLPVMCTFD